MLDLIITFICAAFFGIPIEGLVFWIVLFVQRMYIGGYHAKTQLRCLFISWIVTIISFRIIKMDMSDRVLLYMMGVVTIIIWLAAPWKLKTSHCLNGKRYFIGRLENG